MLTSKPLKGLPAAGVLVGVEPAEVVVGLPEVVGGAVVGAVVRAVVGALLAPGLQKRA